jgi:hypothetical protein
MGHDFFTIRSGLQKAIRRCEVVDTMYACAELDLTGLANSTFQNLLLIASEDIGLAHPKVTGYVTQCYLNWQKKIKAEKIKPSQSFQCESARQELMKAAYVVATAKKSRVVDYCHHMLSIWKIPSSYDLCTLIKALEDKDLEKSLQALRNVIREIWSVHGNKPGYYECIWEVFFKQASNDQIRKLIGDLRQSFQWVAPKIVTFNLVFACLLITQQDYEVTEVIELPSDLIVNLTQKFYSSNFLHKCVKDYAIDMHTAKGKSLKRGEKHFFEVGSFCVNIGYPELYKKIVGDYDVGEPWQEPSPENRQVGYEELKPLLVIVPKIKLKLKQQSIN